MVRKNLPPFELTPVAAREPIYQILISLADLRRNCEGITTSFVGNPSTKILRELRGNCDLYATPSASFTDRSRSSWVTTNIKLNRCQYGSYHYRVDN